MIHARAISICTATMLGGLTILSAQAPNPNLKFEVASIRRIADNGGGGGTAAVAGPGAAPAGAFFRYGGNIVMLIQRAYGVRAVQLQGGPDWIRQDGNEYRIVAKIPDGVAGTPENMRVMIGALLTERFKLVARTEDRTVPVYVLTLAREDKKLGPNLTPVAPDCLVPGSECAKQTRIGGSRGSLSGRNQTMQALANGPFGLERFGRPVIERTGLTGLYDFTLNYADDFLAAGGSQLPSIFSALQEQLGLKLEPQQAPMPIVVVESIERPTEN